MNILKILALSIDNKQVDEKTLVTILELTSNSLNLHTVSEMARLENKSRNGILNSDNYKKIKISKATFAIKGIKNNNLPF